MWVPQLYRKNNACSINRRTYACMFISICIHIHIHVHIHQHEATDRYKHIHTYPCSDTYIHMYTYIDVEFFRTLHMYCSWFRLCRIFPKTGCTPVGGRFDKRS